MTVAEFFPIWNQMTSSEQEQIQRHTRELKASKGTLLHQGSADCAGLLLVQSGQLRAYVLSPDGREVTLYRLTKGDVCLFSASCMMKSIQFDVMIEVAKDCDYLLVPTDAYQQLMHRSAVIANFTNELMSKRFTEVMWLMEQIMWQSFDKRLAGFLLEEAALEESHRLRLTHEIIGNHMGNPREVVTRMLRYFQEEGMVRLSRGMIELVDLHALEALAHR